MKETLLALLVAKFQGVRKDGLNALARSLALQCATEEEANSIVEKITDAQVNDYVKEYRADVDHEVSESNRTFENNLRKKYDLVDKNVVVPGNEHHEEPKTNDISELVAKAVADAVKPFQTELATYKQGELGKSRLESLNAKLANCKDATFKAQTLKDFARMSFATDDDFNQYLADKETDIATANQTLADNALAAGGGSPLFAQKESNGISQSVASFIKSQTEDNEELSGKNLN